MRVIGIIPARMASTRLPGKPLLDIVGLPMIVHTLKRAMLCKALHEVYVATDSEQICKVVEAHGGSAIMTSEKHATGTDRIAEAARKLNCDIVVNIQGDEPLVVPEHITMAVDPLLNDEKILVSTLVVNTDSGNDDTECKVVMDINNDILYMSREDIPSNVRVGGHKRNKLYCIVPFRRDFLFQFAQWEQTPLEKIEFIEYLRIIEMGYKMRAVPVQGTILSVDTVNDLQKVNKLMLKDPVLHKYFG